MTDLAAVVERIAAVGSRDPVSARLTLTALVQTLLRSSGHSMVVVGGTAIDIYVAGAMGTSEGYPGGWTESLDIDTVVMKGTSGVSLQDAVDILERHGFVANQTRSGVRHPLIGIPIDFVGFGYPDDYDLDHIYTIHMEEWAGLGLEPVQVAGPEDILFDYMESGWDTRHQRDWTRALAIAAVFGDALDVGYLFGKAEWRRDGAFVKPLEQILRGEPLRG